MTRLLKVLLVVLFSSSVARAEVVTFAILQDFQGGTDCEASASAWTYLKGAGDWLASSDVDFIFANGDLTNPSSIGDSCYCKAIPYDSPADECDLAVDPYSGQYCAIQGCNDSDAITCTIDGGSLDAPGTFCEWERAKYLTDVWDAAGKCWSVVAGNRDSGGYTGYSYFNDYYGTVAQLSSCSGIVKQDIFQVSSNRPTHSYQVFQLASGLKFLIFSISYVSGITVDPEVDTWMEEIKAKYDRVPTIVASHFVINEACAEADYENAWCGDSLSSVGEFVFDDFGLNRQVFWATGGHIRAVMHALTTTPSGKPLLGTGIDYSLGTPAANPPTVPAWKLDTNAGGGVITIVRLDTVAGRISSQAFSPYARSQGDPEYIDLRGDEGTVWIERMPFCEDRVRFDIPDSACPPRPEVPYGIRR